MNARQLKEKFINFFVARDHVEIPSSSLIPENDPTTLFISAGMHPLVPYLLGQPHHLGKRLTSVQKCIRTGDIDDVGDKFHHTFFEMLGNWSLGDYFKQEMIPWSFEFLTQHLGYQVNQIHVTCFEGDANAPRDTESHDLWLKQGIPESQIHYLPKKDNWWGPAGATGPCGPDTEMFIDLDVAAGPIDFVTGCKSERIVEVGNDVFMEYNLTASGQYEPLSQKNVDTGYGAERNTAVINGFTDNYLTDIWQPIIKTIEQISGKTYYQSPEITRSIRIIADHLKAAVFIISDGVEPSNKEAGYVLRRLIRRAIRHGKMLGIDANFISQIAISVLNNQSNYAGTYPQLDQNRDKILSTLDFEENKFRKTLNRGLAELQKDELNYSKTHSNSDAIVDKKYLGDRSFYYYESFGFPFEMFYEESTLAKIYPKDEVYQYFQKSQQDHIDQSRNLSAGKFKSGLADHSTVIVKYHTAAHLMHASLRRVLGDHVHQAGSNITADRIRFDFTHPDKLTPQQIQQVEALVNDQIQAALPVTHQTIPFADAKNQGALFLAGHTYPDMVTVYTVGSDADFYSKEICTGPHVDNTSQLSQFKILKEESAGSGKRRLYATLK
jgi:alanyl-tRNA synthetase